MKLFSEEHISSMTEIGYAAKSHKLPLSKSLVLKSCKFIRSAWLMEDETFMVVYGTNLLGTNITWINIYVLCCNQM